MGWAELQNLLCAGEPVPRFSWRVLIVPAHPWLQSINMEKNMKELPRLDGKIPYLEKKELSKEAPGRGARRRYEVIVVISKWGWCLSSH